MLGLPGVQKKCVATSWNSFWRMRFSRLPRKPFRSFSVSANIYSGEFITLGRSCFSWEHWHEEMELLLSVYFLRQFFFFLILMIRVDLTVLVSASAKLLYVGGDCHLVVVR